MSTAFKEASILLPPAAPSKAGNIFAFSPKDGDLVDFSVSRGTPGSFIDRDGVMKIAANNVPRWDYSGGGSCSRLLIEQQATNLAPAPNTFASLNAGVVTPNAEIAPDGTMTATRVVLGFLNDSCTMNNITFAAGNVIVSVWLKRISGNPQVSFRKDFGGSNLSNIFIPTDEWQRFFFVFNFGSGGTTTNARLISSVSGTIAIWMENCVQSNILTSTIVNTVSSTRNADVISITNISSRVGQNFVWLIDFFISSISKPTSSLGFLQRDVTNHIRPRIINRDLSLLMASTNGSTGINIPNAFILGRNRLAIMHINGQPARVSINGNPTVIAASSLLFNNNMNSLTIGSNPFGGEPAINDSIICNVIIPRNMTDAELQQLTTL